MMENKNHINELTQSILIHKKHPFNWSFILVFTGPLLAALTLFIMNMANYDNHDSWVNWLMFAIFTPLILVSLIIGQKRELVGAYGETILLLIPTFVWLLPGHAQAHKTMVIVSFAIVLLGFLVYSSATLLKHHKTKDEDKKHKIANVLLRIGFVGSTVTSTIIIGIILINWADLSLNLADIKDPTTGQIYQDYTATPWIVFISVVTISDALILVMLGLITSMKKSHVKTFNANELGYYKKPKKEDKPKSFVEETMLIKLPKDNHKDKE